MTTVQSDFIKEIGPLLQKYAVANGYNIAVVPAMIAQACVESFYKSGLSVLASRYHNYWGMKAGSGYKGSTVNMSTGEEYTVGTITQIRDNFRTYANMTEGVQGYFKFLSYSNYRACKLAKTPEEFAKALKAGGWATSSVYVNSILNAIKNYGTARYGVNEAKSVNYAGVVTASALNVRSAPMTSAEIIQVGGHNFLLPNGICVAFEAETDGWGKLSGVDGWVSLTYVKKG